MVRMEIYGDSERNIFFTSDLLVENKSSGSSFVQEFFVHHVFNFHQKNTQITAIPFVVIFIASGLKGFSGRPLFNFLEETLQSNAIFLVIALMAIGLNKLVHLLTKLEIDKWIIWVIKGLECLLFLVDIIGFLKYLLMNILSLLVDTG